jgi:hypothetical protein
LRKSLGNGTSISRLFLTFFVKGTGIIPKFST